MSVTHTNIRGNAITGVAHSLLTASSTGTDTSASLPSVTTSADGAGAVPVNGLALGGLAAFTVHAGAEAAFAGESTLQAWYFDPLVKGWARLPDWDLSLTEGLTTQAFPAQEIVCPQGWLVYLPDGVGAATTIHLAGCMAR